MKRFFNFNKPKAVELIEQKEVTVLEDPVTQTKQYPEEVVMIHNEFLTASETLLKQAKQILSTNIIEPQIASKSKLASSLGFNKIPEVIEKRKVDEISEKQNQILNAVNKAKSFISTHKWIPESKVEEICKRWNLVFGEVRQYKGFAPEKNLLEIQQFKDKYYDKFWYKSMDIWDFSSKVISQYQTKKEYESAKKHENDDDDVDFYNSIDRLKICAPVKDMVLNSNQTIEKGWKIKNIEIPDPIVLVRKDFNNIKGYFIITAWGDEASDPDVINQNNN